MDLLQIETEGLELLKNVESLLKLLVGMGYIGLSILVTWLISRFAYYIIYQFTRF